MQIVSIRLLAVGTMVLLGVVARRQRWLDGDGTRQISLVVTNLLYPALIYGSLVQTFTLAGLATHWALPAGTIMIMAGGFVIGAVAVRLLPLASARERRAFHFQCAINNYVFLAMPLVQIYWGQDAVALLVFSTVGSELSVWTMGVMALTGHRLRREALRNLLSLPMAAILAAVLTLAVAAVVPWRPAPGSGLDELRRAFLATLDMVGKGTVPLAMLVAGSRMAELQPHHLWRRPQLVLVGLRLGLIPAVAIVALRVLPFGVEARNVLTVVAVMPSAIASVMLSDIYEADRDFAASAVLLTHGAALITIPLWLGWLL